MACRETTVCRNTWGEQWSSNRVHRAEHVGKCQAKGVRYRLPLKRGSHKGRKEKGDVGKAGKPTQQRIKSDKWETAPQPLRQPRTKKQGDGDGIASRYRRQKENQSKREHRLGPVSRKVSDDVFALSATESLDSTSRGNTRLGHELGRPRLADAGYGNQQANYGNAPVSRVGRGLLEGDGTLADQIEQRLALLTDKSGLLQVLSALFISQNRQGIGRISHRVTRFHLRIGRRTAQESTRR